METSRPPGWGRDAGLFSGYTASSGRGNIFSAGCGGYIGPKIVQRVSPLVVKRVVEVGFLILAASLMGVLDSILKAIFG